MNVHENYLNEIHKQYEQQLLLIEKKTNEKLDRLGQVLNRNSNGFNLVFFLKAIRNSNKMKNLENENMKMQILNEDSSEKENLKIKFEKQTEAIVTRLQK